jgi:hypothetical protein
MTRARTGPIPMILNEPSENRFLRCLDFSGQYIGHWESSRFSDIIQTDNERAFREALLSRLSLVHKWVVTRLIEHRWAEIQGDTARPIQSGEWERYLCFPISQGHNSWTITNMPVLVGAGQLDSCGTMTNMPVLVGAGQLDSCGTLTFDSPQMPSSSEEGPELFKWSEARFRARKAAKEYSKQTHADY